MPRKGLIDLSINVQLINFDTCIKESVVKNADDSYTIFINAKLSHEKQCEVYNHAIAHIENCDFEKLDADKIEFEAHSA